MLNLSALWIVRLFILQQKSQHGTERPLPCGRTFPTFAITVRGHLLFVRVVYDRKPHLVLEELLPPSTGGPFNYLLHTSNTHRLSFNPGSGPCSAELGLGNASAKDVVASLSVSWTCSVDEPKEKVLLESRFGRRAEHPCTIWWKRRRRGVAWHVLEGFCPYSSCVVTVC